MSCSVSKLTDHLSNVCRPLAVGVYENMYVGQISQIASFTVDSANPLLITAFTLKSGEKLKRWQGLKQTSQKTSVGFESNDYGNNVPHGFEFTNFDTTALGKNQVNIAKNINDLIVFAKQAGQYGEWEIFGFVTGMACTGLARDSSDANTPGQYRLTYSAAQEKDLPYSFKHITSSVEDTEAFLITQTTTIP